MRSGIYKITNNVTGKFYIGSAKDIDWRWTIHQRDLRGNRHCNPKLQHSWNFHGEPQFTFVVIEETTSDQSKLFEREQYYLDTLKPYERSIGYNIGSTANGGDNITHNPDREAFIEKMKIINHGENNGMYGKLHTNEAIQKQKTKAIGRYTLDWFIDRYGKREGKKKYNERRLMLADRPKECFSHPCDMKGKRRGPMSIESRQKISEAKHRMKTQKSFLIKDIQSDKYTALQLCEKYNIGITAVKYYKRRLKLST